MFISKKRYKALLNRVERLERERRVHSFFFGDVSFEEYVRLSEKAIFEARQKKSAENKSG